MHAVLMSSKDTKIYEFKKHRKSSKTPFIISLGLESFIKRTDRCRNRTCIPVWIQRWLAKILQKIITTEKRFLQSPKYGRFYWCRLHTPKSIYKKFAMKKLGKYHVLYVESDTYC